jgi:hypothetical protein
VFSSIGGIFVEYTKNSYVDTETIRVDGDIHMT